MAASSSSSSDSLLLLSAALNAAAARASLADDLGAFIIKYPAARQDMSSLIRELSEIQMASRLLVHSAKAVDENAAQLPDKFRHALKNVVQKTAIIPEHVELALEDGGEDAQRQQAWLEHTAERISPLARLAESCRLGMSLGLDVVLFATNLAPVDKRGELPPYDSSQMVQDAANIIDRLEEDAESEDSRILTLRPHLLELAEAVQEYMDQTNRAMDHNGDTPTGGGQRITVESLHSQAEPPPPISSPPPEEATPDYHAAIGITHPAPLTITLTHVTKKEFGNIEILQTAFIQRNNNLAVALSSMDTRTRFFDLNGNQVGTLANQHGVDLCFARNGRSWAYLTEEEPKNMTHWSHDGVHFRRPTVVLGDYVNGRRIHQMRWPGARPLAFSLDGSLLAVASARNRVVILNHRAGSLLDKTAIVMCHSDDVTQAAFTPDNSALVTQSRDGTIRLTDPTNGQSIAKLDTDSWKKPDFLGISPDGNVIASIRGDEVFHWNHTTAVLESYPLGSRRVREGWPIAVSHDCRFLCCRNDIGVDISDLYSGRVLHTIRFQSGFVTAASFSDDGRYLALGKAASWLGNRVTTATLDIWQLNF